MPDTVIRRLRPGLAALVGLALGGLPLSAQFAGPAILSRGEAPAALQLPQIDFRPFVEFNGTYNTGLAGVGTNSSGGIGTFDDSGIQLNWGISGTHSWRHSKVGMDYRGTLSEYQHNSYFDSTQQALLLGISHQFTRHTMLSLRESAGIFSQAPSVVGIQSTVPFDPLTSYVPQTDYFDNRTVYAITQADFIVQKSARLSFDIGGDGNLTFRRSSALTGVKGETARGDAQYRLARTVTVGASYSYDHFSFTRTAGGTDLHMGAGTFAWRMTKTMEISAYGGIYRIESKFVQTLPVDPVIQALLGITGAPQIVHSVNYSPSFSGRFSKTFPRGVLYISGGRSVTPGNGLFLTSEQDTALMGYGYTGLRRWTFQANARYTRASSLGNISGDYTDEGAGVTLARQLRRFINFTSSFNIHKYLSPSYSNYNRLFSQITVGIGLTTGDVPLRLW